MDYKSFIDQNKEVLTFDDIRDKECIRLYAGNLLYDDVHYQNQGLVGLALNHGDRNTICHDVSKPYALKDNSVDYYQAEDVFEHIAYECLPATVNEIYRIMKPSGVFRLSVPDYRCDILYERSLKDDKGEILFDEGGGGCFLNGKVVGGGHVWFPRYESVLNLVKGSKFKNYKFYHYYDENGKPVTHTIDYSIGYVKRTPDHDKRVSEPYRPMSIVVDLIK